MAKSKKKLIFDRFEWKGLSAPVIGVDEVGRGCLAGPVCAGAAILNPDLIPEGLTDSKVLTEAKRELFAEQLTQHHQVEVAFASVEEICEINILQASFLAMRRAIEQLNVSKGTVLVDGPHRIPDLPPTFKQIPLVKGDLRATPISAAAIVAKVTRDRLLKEMDEVYPGYGLKGHKGYSTVAHKMAIQKLGATPFHRSTFSGVREYL